ncbi:MAG: SAP domain-containing protein [Candidatus Thalassarchaeaceae archaeon]|jgi:small subunit ribosomal protein S3Ae|nr:SAP domain-containing protein [Candidatus Thalassarchaeaceae archaeon]
MAAKGAKARAAARKQRDKWKSKRWFTIRAPRQPWQYKVIGETLGETREHIIDRIYETTQNEVDGDFSKMHVKLRFRVVDTRGEDALTEYIGHALQNDYVRRQIRRHRGRVDDVVDCVTADGYYIRIKPVAVASHRIKSSQKSQMRKLMKDTILQFTARSTWLDVQNALLTDSMEKLLIEAIKPIHPSKSVMIRKVQLIQSGVVTDEGPTLDEIHEDEKNSSAEIAAKKAAALEKAMAGEDDDSESSGDDVGDEAEDQSEEPTEAEDASSDQDLSGLTVAELKERCKAAGLKVGGKKADLIARLSE